MIATAVMVTLRKRELSQERTQPGLGICLPEIRQVSAETEKQQQWRFPAQMPRESNAVLHRAEVLALEAKMNAESRGRALQELEALYSEISSDTREASQVLHLLGKVQGMWGDGDLETSLKTLRQVLAQTQEAALQSQVNYEIGLTLELGLKDLEGADQAYKRAIQLSPNGLHGLLAADRLSLKDGN